MLGFRSEACREPAMNRSFARTVSATLIVATTALTFPNMAGARIVGTEEAARTESVAPLRTDRETLRALLERADVRARLESLGVDPRHAELRVDALTDEEIGQMAGQVGGLPAGGSSIVGVLFAVFVILLITDLLGLTRVFPFIRR
jgi:hypothetical protein